MHKLPFLGRRNTAGGLKLAVFFFCLFIITGCPANADGSDSAIYPFVVNGQLYTFSPQAIPAISHYDFKQNADKFTQKGVSASKKQGFILAWNSKTKNLYHINANQKVVSSVNLNSSLVYVGQQYVLAQNSSFSDNKGFSFTLYKIKYAKSNRKIALTQVWTGFADCFVSDNFFTDDGVCICGGTRDNTKHNVFYITKKGIHKCFTATKNSDFMRIINCGEKIYGFMSGREKTAVEPVIYKFALDNYMEETDSQAQISLKNDTNLPQDYECFFGYGFATNGIVLPASINGQISFIVYDPAANKISTVAADAAGCTVPLGQTPDGFYYIARDPTIEDSWYGIALFDGNSCKKIKKIQ